MALDEQFMVELVNDTISTINNRKLNDQKQPILEYIKDNKITKTSFLKYKQKSFTKSLKTHLQKKSIDAELLKLYNSINIYFEPIYTIGDTVKLNTPNSKNNLGIIRFVGPIEGRKGTFLGIELNTANGTCDGALNEVEYFVTKAKSAIFIKKKQINKCELQIVQKSDNIRCTVGDIVYIAQCECNAVVRFIGFVDTDQIKYGVQCEQEKGTNDGTLNQRKYFRCQDKFGLFLSADEITVIDRNAKYLKLSLQNSSSNGSETEIEDEISYASSADFGDYDSAVERIHFFVTAASDSDSEFKAPMFAEDIDTNDERYVGVTVGDRRIDIAQNLKKLGISENECVVMAFKEIKVNEQSVLERVFDNKYFEDNLVENDGSEEVKSENENENSENADSFKMVDFKLFRQKSKIMSDRSNELKALRMKYSSRKVVLHGKRKEKQPKCSECETYYHIQSDPLNAYDGVGIVCEICGKNRRDNPELILEDTYYTCEGCGGIDICKMCYMKQKRALKRQFSK